MKRQILALVVLAVLPTALYAQNSLRRGTGVSEKAKAPQTTVEKRVWLSEEAAKGLNNKQELQNLRQFIDQMQPQQIDAFANAVLAQQLPPQNPNMTPQQLLRQAQLELARARAIRRELENLYWQQRRGGNRVGYAPVITWLPQGTSLGASAVVSPDRRYVRVNANPFFSSVGPVYTYNLNTGETRLMPQYPGGYPGYGQPSYGQPSYRQPTYGMPPGYPQQQQTRTPSSQPKKIYRDGLRTRVGR